MGYAAEVHHKVGTKLRHEIVNQGILCAVTLDKRVVERDDAGNVHQKQRNSFGPAAALISVVPVEQHVQ